MADYVTDANADAVMAAGGAVTGCTFIAGTVCTTGGRDPHLAQR